MDNSYLIYATTKDYDLSDRWGGCHITIAGTHKSTHKSIKNVVQGLNQDSSHDNWHPTDWKIKNWKGRWTMVINTNRLLKVAEELEGNGAKKLKGPGYGKCNFHVTLPETIASKAAAKQYASELSKKDWFITVSKKEKSTCKWSDYVLLKK